MPFFFFFFLFSGEMEGARAREEGAAPVEKKSRSKSSWTWHYFVQEAGASRATCKLCKRQIAADADKLKQHLQSKSHGITKQMYEEERAHEDAATRNAATRRTPGSQPPLPFEPVQKGAITLAPLTRSQQDELHMDMMLVRVDELTVSALFEDQSYMVGKCCNGRMSLKKFLLRLRPDLLVPSRQALDELRAKEWLRVKQIIKDDLKDIPFLGGMSDGWTSSANVSYRTLSVCGVTKDWRKRIVYLDTCPVPRHTDAAFSEYTTRVFTEYEIEQKVFQFNADGGEKSAVLAAGFEYDHDACHVINLIIQKATEWEQWRKVVEEVKSVVTAFRKSPLQTHLMELAAEAARLEAVEAGQSPDGFDVVKFQAMAWTRWSSMLNCLRSIIKNKLPFQAYCKEQSKPDPFTRSATWLVLDDMVKVLAPLEEVTRAFSSFEATSLMYATKLLIMPGYYSMLEPKLNTVMGKEYCQYIVEELRSRISASWDVEDIALQLAVAPRGFSYVKSWFAACHFQDYHFNQLPGLPRDPAVWQSGPDKGKAHPNAGKPSCEQFGNLMLHVLQKQAATASLSIFAEISEPVDVAPLDTGLDFTSFGGAVSSSMAVGARTSESEVHAYARASQGDMVSLVERPLDYWRMHCHLFPRIGVVALKKFSKAAAAVFPEQTWSLAGYLTKDRRSKLGPDSLNEILGLYWNRMPKYGICGVDNE
jgi:hypothetical protein